MDGDASLTTSYVRSLPSFDLCSTRLLYKLLTAKDIKHTGTAAGEESYAITANLDKTVQITATFTRPSDAPGFKYGQGEKGGFSYLGKDKTDGFVIQ